MLSSPMDVKGSWFKNINSPSRPRGTLQFASGRDVGCVGGEKELPHHLWVIGSHST